MIGFACCFSCLCQSSCLSLISSSHLCLSSISYPDKALLLTYLVSITDTTFSFPPPNSASLQSIYTNSSFSRGPHTSLLLLQNSPYLFKVPATSINRKPALESNNLGKFPTTTTLVAPSRHLLPVTKNHCDGINNTLFQASTLQ